VADDAMDLCIAKSVNETDELANQVRDVKLGEVHGVIWTSVPSCCSTIASLIWNYDIVSFSGKRGL